ncbi:SAVED domain-containing protein [Clostridium sp. MB40-C1]|uniref:SAVED domain-containing protein n=1 Tax=Clostridium sp. MB40-C1 TaxID=3070996 RepID=UPI0027E00CD7|nr:SAVED domain-containing protein [Clostridium sp. MB40-C1]WMJ81470.1 SAVED domain-containing protein [Clostridium sp. MB40-C1]
MWNKIVKFILNINKSILTKITIVSGAVTFVWFIPKFVKYLHDIYAQLNNEIVKNGISFITDMDILVNGFKGVTYISICIFVVCLIIIVIRLIYKNKKIIDKVIIGHSSMSPVQFKAETNSEYEVREINLIDNMKENEDDYNKIKYAINKQDKFVDEFKRNINSKYEYGYMGIAHTPLILRMGNQIGDEIDVVLFHKYRTGNTKVFKELSNNKEFKHLSILRSHLKESSNELIVGLSTTYPIKYEELDILKPDDKNIIIFGLNPEELRFDVITSEKQVEDYTQYIMKEVRSVVKDNNITKIHMVLSTSVAMTFAVGQAISLNNDPSVTIYHYDINNSRKYTWGIDLSKDYDKCIVDTGSENFD